VRELRVNKVKVKVKVKVKIKVKIKVKVKGAARAPSTYITSGENLG
jgi:hypothetical protein